MSTVPISSSLSASCASALNGAYPNLNAACGINGNVAITNVLANSDKVLSTICSYACSQEIPKFTAATNSTCGNELIFQDDKATTANYYSSYLQVVAAAGCVKDSNGNYCLARQMGEVSRNGVNLNSSDAGARIISYSSKNMTFTCSTCVGDEITSLKSLLAKGSIDSTLASSVQSVIQIPSLSCPKGFHDDPEVIINSNALSIKASLTAALLVITLAI